MKRVIILLLGIVVSSYVFAQQKNFSGTWKIELEKSDLGGLAADVAAPKSIQVVANIKTITVKRIFGSDEPNTLTLNFSGEQVEKISTDGNTLAITHIEKEKSNILIFKTHYEVGGKEWEYDRKETWILSADGKLLTVERITTLPDKVDKVRAVYERERKLKN